jgi:hypothetical protein
LGTRKNNPSRVEQRVSPIRRQFNQAFCDPNGDFNIGKFLVLWTQIGILAQAMRFFEDLIAKPESLLVILTFLIAPEIIKKALVLKLGGQTTTETSESSVKTTTKGTTK